MPVKKYSCLCVRIFFISTIFTKYSKMEVGQMLCDMTFGKGAKDGLPIAMGYISVAFAFGMIAVQRNAGVVAGFNHSQTLPARASLRARI